MKSNPNLKAIAKSWTEEEYRAKPYLSYSAIAKYAREGFDGYLHLHDDEKTDSLIFGSAVDTYITGGKEEFEAKYVCSPLGEITGKPKDVLVYLFENRRSYDVKSLYNLRKKDWEEALNAVSYFKNRTFDGRMSAFLEFGQIKQEYEDFFVFLCESNGKTVLTEDVYSSVVSTAESLLNDEFVGKFLRITPFNDDVELFWQQKFVATFNGITYKCMADLIIVNHKTKKIYPYDLKTTSNKEVAFPLSFVKWRYDIQARLYYRIINSCVKHSKDFREYEVQDYSFIVVSRYTQMPLIWHFASTKLEGLITLDGKNDKYRLEDPFDLGKELNELIKREARVPLYVDRGKINNIEYALKCL